MEMDEVGGVRGFRGGTKAECPIRICLGDEIGGLDMETRREREYLKLPSLLQWLPLFSGRLAWQVSRKNLLELGLGIMGCMRRKVGEDLCDALGMKTERKGTQQLGVTLRDQIWRWVGGVTIELGGLRLQLDHLLPWL